MVALFKEEHACHATQADEDDFIFMYDTIFEDLGISLPFDFFFAEVLWTLGIVPSQLHPNSWAVLQDFKTVCQALSIKPMTPFLFSFYTAEINQGASWVSFAAKHRMNLFRPYLKSYRGFKNRYVKVVPVKDAPYYGRGTHLLVLAYAKPGTKSSGYHLSAMIQQGKTAAGNKSVGLTVDSTPPPAVSTTSIMQQKLAFKLVPAPPPLPSPKRKVASSPSEGEVKKAKPTKAILAVEPPLVATPSEIMVVDVGGIASEQIREADIILEKVPPIVADQGTSAAIPITDSSTPAPTESIDRVERPTSSGKEDSNTVAGPSGTRSLWGIRLDPPSLRLGVKLDARDHESLLSIGIVNSLNVVAASCIRTTAIVNALRLALLQMEKLAQEGLWSRQEMAKLLNDNSEIKRANQQLLEDNTNLRKVFQYLSSENDELRRANQRLLEVNTKLKRAN
ncbi:hypothetical protein CR513_04581, partial [Mucuna pruriens]